MNNKGDFVAGLRREDFQAFLDKEPATIDDFSDTDVPLSVGIVFDASGSFIDQPSGGTKPLLISSLQQALTNFLGVGNKSNEYFLLAFNNKPQLLLDWTSDSKSLVDSVSDVRPQGITALFDGCYLAMDKVQRGRYSKRVLILLSDGQDNNSTYTFVQLREALRESDVLLYAINFPHERDAGSVLEMEGQGILKELSSLSGGRFFSRKEGRRLKVSDATLIFEYIATELRHQYTIGIKPQISNVDRKWHKIKVKIKSSADGSGKMKGLSVRAREGFYLSDR
ncbi:MAG: VWA domain-containing protein [Acidobacteriota bacterium]|nr:VWA domain-containing protein [Acidobacteriota bacterium]